MNYRKIVAYHPTVAVRRESGEVVTIEVDMDDWYTDQEVIDKLLVASGGKTLNDVVDLVICGGFDSDLSIGVLGVRVVV